MICAPEEIAYRNGWIDRGALEGLIKLCGKSSYGKHLKNIVDDKIIY